MKPIRSYFRRNSTTVTRTNVSGPSTVEDERVSITTSSRYVDPLIKNNYSDVSNPLHREMVAQYDPIARLLTHIRTEVLLAENPKFYLTDDVDAVEIMQDVRQNLDRGNLKSAIVEAFTKTLIHGWCIVYPYIDWDGLPNARVFSEYEIRPEFIVRDEYNNIIGYWVNYTNPLLPLNRNTGSVKPYHFYLSADQVIHVTRGKWNYGFGESVFAGIWDALTKLREESNANAFRSRIFSMVTVPNDWSEEQIRKYMNVIAHIDERNTLVQRAGVDINGNPIPDLPKVVWSTPVAGSAQKSSQGGSPQISDLSSEWSRLCAGTNHTMGYFLGGGIISASRAAAGVDLTQDQLVDIQLFNDVANKLIMPLLQYFDGVIGVVNKTFTIKCWMQWQRDEAIVANQIKERQQLEAQMNRFNPNQQQNDRINIVPNRFIPVNSESGNVETAFLADYHDGSVPTLYVKYRNPYNWYQYQSDDPDEMIQAAEAVVAEGGEAVWRILRGKTQSYPDGVPDSLKGMPKRSFSTRGRRPVPFAGRVEDQLGIPYQTSRGPSIPEETEESEEQQESPGQPTEPTERTEPTQPKKRKTLLPTPSAGDTVKTSPGTFTVQTPKIETQIQSIETKVPTIEEQYKKIRIFFGKPYMGYVPPADDHPLLKRHNSVSGMRRDLHIGYNKAIKMIEQPLDITKRFNLAHVGNAFSSKNPYKYQMEDGLRFEFIPPEEIRKNVGKKVPLGVFHDLNGNVDLPDWQIIGEYEIYDADDERDYARINFFDDWKDRLPEIKRRLLNSGWTAVEGFVEWVNDLENLIENGEYDISTAIETQPRFNYAKRRWEQTNIELHSVSIVPVGNCTKPYCKVGPMETTK